ncbi:sensor histidine kinase [Marinoscillum furvescens]|uniref:histidine kinase n=1 Tax=Marinoscillum furvescens DSM 4134 TaxID=1122208 RepID=A0A3D9L545_MARFU|nr:PAS domain S-box protein [Marinoscillum furvescens]RED99445.1 PAS domain S-box-containing protein [Marinoscillum furvescens DSM 4134]
MLENQLDGDLGKVLQNSGVSLWTFSPSRGWKMDSYFWTLLGESPQNNWSAPQALQAWANQLLQASSAAPFRWSHGEVRLLFQGMRKEDGSLIGTAMREPDLSKAKEYVTYVEHSPRALAMFDRKMHYLAVSDQWLEDYKLTREAVIGQSQYDVFPQLEPRWSDIYRKCLAGSVIKSDGERSRNEQGEIQWMSWDIRPWYSEAGAVGGLLIMTEDITAQKKAEEQIRLSEEKFRGAFDYASIGMALVGLDGGWIRVNKAICDMVGYTEEELLDLTFQDITHPEDLDKDLSLLQELVAGARDTYQMEKRYFHKDGSVVYIYLAVSKVTDANNEPLFFISQITDISEMKRSQHELQAKNSQLEQYAYIASHDLREPLNTVRSFLNIMSDDYKGKVDEQFDTYLAFMQESSHRMSELIQSLLAHSRLSEPSISLEEIDLNRLVSDVVMDLNHVIEKSGAEVKVLDLPHVRGDAMQLRMLFQNLITNGIKFQSGDTTPEVIVGVKGDSFFVKDNGIGISKQHYERIFQLFQRLNARERFAGSGVGLSNCRRIVEHHEGELWLKSTPGMGSTFYFTLWQHSKKGAFVNAGS